jgi:hypothetical protein
VCIKSLYIDINTKNGNSEFHYGYIKSIFGIYILEYLFLEYLFLEYIF